MVNFKKKDVALSSINKLVQGNTITYSQIQGGNDQEQLIQSKFGGPVVTFSFNAKNPTVKNIFINHMEHQGKDCKVSIFNASGTPTDVDVTGWELPL
ncbi:hypothetical protein [Bacillus safensis]|uniref:hypothetical protein n=1 Tax=Bacillus safensis TaxID=561879 RepID=UPI0018E0E981|nr:hypothetical protein [Bacillus safensis]MBI1630298.1 hypothetical protein [Bacillus safensis]